MTKIKFEKIGNKLTKEEMKTLKGGDIYHNGDTVNGDTYSSSSGSFAIGDSIVNGKDQFPGGGK